VWDGDIILSGGFPFVRKINESGGSVCGLRKGKSFGFYYGKSH